MVLGDNVLYGDRLRTKLRAASRLTTGAIIFGYRVRDPDRYGVVTFDRSGRATSIEEKPTSPQSNYAVTGLYFFDARAVEIARGLTPSARGELEITDVIRAYLDDGSLNLQLLSRGVAWLDTGTHESLLRAANFIETIEVRQGLKIACLEEIALREGWITVPQLDEAIEAQRGNSYGEYLAELRREFASGAGALDDRFGPAGQG